MYKVLIVDNFDSFTYNLHHMINRFIDICDVARGDQLDDIDINRYDKIVLSPGPCLPSDHSIIFDVLREYSENKSILGVCLGHQAIAEYFGSSLINMNHVKHGVVSENFVVSKDPIFRDIPNRFIIGHYHSWIVDEDSVPDCIEVTSKNDDGFIMSLRHKYLDISGLQFHPESILTSYGEKIIENWISS